MEVNKINELFTKSGFIFHIKKNNTNIPVFHIAQSHIIESEIIKSSFKYVQIASIKYEIYVKRRLIINKLNPTKYITKKNN